MDRVLVLGAGLVSKPLVDYLLQQPGFFVTMASRTVSKAENIISNHPQGKAESLNVSNDMQLEKLVSMADLVVSLLPYTYHVKVAKLCLKHRKHMVTTSYVSEEMHQLDEAARQTGVVFLNECGLDPGIDHMSAMRVIHKVQKNGGKITSFRSTTGALPAHEVNNNPFGYKFSWSPRGVLLASRNAAKWLENGDIIEVPGKDLFEHYSLQDVPGAGVFENYPNRNSLPYKDIYGIEDAHTVYRGTFRMTGWCETLRYLVLLGWLNDTPLPGFSGETYADVTRTLIKAEPNKNLESATAEKLGLKPFSAVIKRFGWLGLFSDEPLPPNRDNPLDYLNVITLNKMSLGRHERDMIVMHHEFIAEFPTKKQYITSTLVDYGIPNGDSSVSRTVGLPAAIAVKMILQKKIVEPGVHIPVKPHIYNPILDDLASMDIVFQEETTPL